MIDDSRSRKNGTKTRKPIPPMEHQFKLGNPGRPKGSRAMDWRRLDERIEGLSAEIEAVAAADTGCERLMSFPGLGPIIASATVAAIGTGEVFSKKRDFAAWLGLVLTCIAYSSRKERFGRKGLIEVTSSPTGRE